MNRSILSVVVVSTFVGTLLSPAFGGPTDTQKCQSKKIQEAGKYSLCRMKAEAKAAKDGSTPDFSKCDSKLSDKFQKIDTQFGLACPTSGDAGQVQNEIASWTAALACQLLGAGGCTSTCQEPEPAGGSIIALADFQVGSGNDPILKIRNRGNQLVYATCFFASSAGCSPTRFQVSLPLQSEISWAASLGSQGDGIPALGGSFSGDLVCVEMDAAGSPIGGNHLVASATYPGQCVFATPITGSGDNNDGDTVLCLGGLRGRKGEGSNFAAWVFTVCASGDIAGARCTQARGGAPFSFATHAFRKVSLAGPRGGRPV